MPAHESEVHEAEQEGVRFRWLSTIGDVEESSIIVEQMELDGDRVPACKGCGICVAEGPFGAIEMLAEEI